MEQFAKWLRCVCVCSKQTDEYGCSEVLFCDIKILENVIIVPCQAVEWDLREGQQLSRQSYRMFKIRNR